jgi:aspartyl-tRNA(Asn)/glutamyl-tRNA(Gln) amidotransferase subunit A
VAATDLGAVELAAAIRDGELSSVEAVGAYAERVEAVDGPINAVVVRRFDEALEEAREADRAVAAGEETRPLHGVPVTIKEAIAVAGLPWTNGSRLTAGAVAEMDAPSVRRLRGAGAIVIGKTNVPEFCAWFDTDNDVYGRTCNPHDHERTPGGSSGGESAALAARMSPLGLGSDLASSIRQPAAWTGVVGLKPSRGLVPMDGHAGFGLPPAWKSSGVIGPMARTVADLAAALAVLADVPVAVPDAAPGTVAVYEDDGLQPVAASCRAAVRSAAAALTHAGWPVEDALPPDLAEIRRCFDVQMATEFRLFGLPHVTGREHELSEYGRRSIAGLDRVQPDLEKYARAGMRMNALEFAAEAWQERHPIALCPVVPTTAPVAAEGWGDVDGEPFRPGGKLTLCTWANAIGAPALSVPCGRDAAGLPVAVQVIGRRGRDGDVLAAGLVIEQALGGAVLV